VARNHSLSHGCEMVTAYRCRDPIRRMSRFAIGMGVGVGAVAGMIVVDVIGFGLVAPREFDAEVPRHPGVTFRCACLACEVFCHGLENAGNERQQ
jgi:hypothetical protein